MVIGVLLFSLIVVISVLGEVLMVVVLSGISVLLSRMKDFLVRWVLIVFLLLLCLCRRLFSC